MSHRDSLDVAFGRAATGFKKGDGWIYIDRLWVGVRPDDFESIVVQRRVIMKPCAIIIQERNLRR